MEIWKRERRRRKEIKETIDNGEEREGERERLSMNAQGAAGGHPNERMGVSVGVAAAASGGHECAGIVFGAAAVSAVPAAG